MSKFLHLTGKSVRSPLQGIMSAKQIVKVAKEYGMEAVGLTDDNNFYGLFDFYKACKGEGIKPVVGVTLNVCFKDHTIHEDNPYYTIHLMVKDLEGYQNLNTIITIAQTEGRESGESNHKPKIFYKEIFKYAKGLICMTGGFGGIWNEVLSVKSTVDNTPWEEMLLEFNEVFKDDFYIEIQDHGIGAELEVNVELLKLHNRHDIPVVLTHNYEYKDASQAFAREVVRAIQSGRTVPRDLREYVIDNFDTLDFAKDTKFKEFLKDGNEFTFKKPEEMESHKLLQFFPELLDNIQVIVDKCNLKLNLDNPELPSFPLPKEYTTDEDYFRALSIEGFKKRLKLITKYYDRERFSSVEELMTVYQDRLNYEMDMICQMGFPGYFLVVWDVCRFAREEFIPMAPGRGSVAGSLVAYCLEITGIDPIAKDLLFERFLNPARVSMPDIDLDFDSSYRSKVLEYTYNKYGYDYVAQIISFSTLSAKPSIECVCKVLQMTDKSVVDTSKYNEFAEYIKKFISANVSISDNISSNDELQELYNNNQSIKIVLDIAKQIENGVRATSMHAGGVVIGKFPIAQYIPSQKAKVKASKEDDNDPGEENVQLEGVVIQADKKACEPLGLIKMDYLATAVLSKIRISLSYINRKLRKQGKKEIDFYELCDYVQYTTSVQDPEMYKILQEGNSLMVFQCENPALGNVLTQFYPETFEDVTAILALYRPGPMANIPTYIANKNNPENVDYMHEDLVTVLKETFGIIVYQEQIMQLVQVWAGFTLAEADLIRRAIGKKEADVLKKEGEKFVAKATELGRDPKLSQHLYDLIVKFAEYGFNKSHAASYAVLALVTAWLKAYYPLEYTMCWINSFSTAQQKPVEKISNYIMNIKDMGYETLPPHVNASEYLFSIEDNKLRHGFFSIKGATERSMKSIVEERKQNGSYESLHNFVTRNIKATDDELKKDGFRVEALDKATLESLILTNSFEGITYFKKSELAPKATEIIDFYKKSFIQEEKRERDDQLDLFAEFNIEIEDEKVYEPEKEETEYHWSYILKQELDKMRTTYSIDIAKYTSKISNLLTFRKDFDNLTYKHAGKDKKPHLYENKNKLICYGLINAKRKLGKSGREMLFMTFRDHTGIIETTLFSDQFQKYKFFLEQNANAILVFTGKLQRTVYGKTGHESKVYNFNIEEMFTLEEVVNNPLLLKKDMMPEMDKVEATYTPNTTVDLPSLNKNYNIIHIKVSNDMELKETLKAFFINRDNATKDSKIVIHNYFKANIKLDVVVANKYTLNVSDIQDLIKQGVLNKRDVIIANKVQPEPQLV